MPCSMWTPPNTRGVDGMLAFYSVATPVWDSFTATLGDPGNDLRLLAALPPLMLKQWQPADSAMASGSPR